MCTEFIFRHINQLPPTDIFTTREMLIYGERPAVDSALSRMVSAGFLNRLARGVFSRDLPRGLTLLQIVETKIKAFGGKVVPHAKKFLKDLNLSSEECATTFAKNGSSSSFETILGPAVLKNTCARKMRLYEEKVGQAGIALWQMVPWKVRHAVDVVTEKFNRSDRELLLFSSSLLPARITAECAYRFPYFRVKLQNPFLTTHLLAKDQLGIDSAGGMLPSLK